MQLASNSTTPSSLGRPPYPTLLSRGSSSTIFTPATTASSVSPPLLISSMALAQQLMPPLNALALDTTTGLGRAWAAACRTMGSAATPNITARLLRLMSFMKILLPPGTVRRILERVHIMSYANREGVVRYGKGSSFAGECPAHYVRHFRNDGQVRAGGRGRLTPALFPLLQGSFADAIGSREFGLRHLDPLANRLYVDWLGPDLFEFDFTALVRQDQRHSLDQVRCKCGLFRRRFLGHSNGFLSDEPRLAVILSFRPRSDLF